MKLSEIVSFRKDLLFNGAVQINWFEDDSFQTEKAVRSYVFHGPDYHGVANDDLGESEHVLVDSASFTLDLIKRISGNITDEPFALAIAGYGTGKSHLGLTLAALLSKPHSLKSQEIIKNIKLADTTIGEKVEGILASSKQPFLVIAINGMQDFDLSQEIIRQVMKTLTANGLSIDAIANLRQRFTNAANFTGAFFEPLKREYELLFGECSRDVIIQLLREQDERAFQKASQIYEQKMGFPIPAVGRESIHDFIRSITETYCGPGRPFAGMMIVFDEFGRYLEFSVQKPHIAGPGSMQQLFEAVQSNKERIFLLGFIQYELKAYISRVAPELQQDLNRYVTRYDGVEKVRLSTNLETLIANLIEKKTYKEVRRQLETSKENIELIQSSMKRWFPDLKNHKLWMDKNRFLKIVCLGCWPLHPLATWVLYKLSAVGKFLQQRSALTLLADNFIDFLKIEFSEGRTITAVELCSESMINEFLASERFGQQGNSAHSLVNIIDKYRNQLSDWEVMALKAMMLMAKIGIKVDSKNDYIFALSAFCDKKHELISQTVSSLELEYGVIRWNARLYQYEIVGDGVPRWEFQEFIESKAAEIDSATRADIFSHSYSAWTGKNVYKIDYEPEMISTSDWNYQLYFSNVSLIEKHIELAFRNWSNARSIDESKGQLVYCYIGPESNPDIIRKKVSRLMQLKSNPDGLNCVKGAPIGVILLWDNDGSLGDKIAEYWVLAEKLSEEESKKYAKFVLERSSNLLREIENQFTNLERVRDIVFPVLEPVPGTRIKELLGQIFIIVYPLQIPFPFDGFGSQHGKAAKDCGELTKMAFQGNLDREQIISFQPQQRNRAQRLLDGTWGFFNDDGSLRLKPKHPGIRELFNSLEALLERKDRTDPSLSSNMGAMMRLICAPPFGGNIASAGLLLGLFIGCRRNNIQLLKNHQVINVENWLSEAMRGNFLKLQYLNETSLMVVSQENLSEWERLMEDWDTETTLLGNIQFLHKAEALEKRVAVPQAIYYRYAHLNEQAKAAQQRITELNNKVNKAVQVIEKGKKDNNFRSLVKGTMQLSEISATMESDRDQWTNEQNESVAAHLSQARLAIQGGFSKWLRQVVVRKTENLALFEQQMHVTENHLQKLGYIEEKEQLEEKVAEIKQHVRLLEELRRMEAEIDNMIEANKVSDSIPVLMLETWLEQADRFEKRIKKAREKTDLVKMELADSEMKLTGFIRSCKKQKKFDLERFNQVFHLRQINSLRDIKIWRDDLRKLIWIFEGKQEDLPLLRHLEKQLEQTESHFIKLSDDNLNEEEFRDLSRQMIIETELRFKGGPPIKSELIHSNIVHLLTAKRKALAEEWIKKNVPDKTKIDGFTASQASDYKVRLRRVPRVLSREQIACTNDAVAACENRLSALEVEGLLAQFEALSEENRKKFLIKLKRYLN